MDHTIRPFVWFNGRAQEAAEELGALMVREEADCVKELPANRLRPERE